MPQLEAAGEIIPYLKAGSGPNTILLVHGFGSDARSWTMNQPALAAGATVYALAPAGLGATPSPDFVRDFLAMTDAASAETALKMLVANPALINRQIVDGVLAARNRPHSYAAWQMMQRIGLEIWARQAEAHAAMMALPMPAQVIWGEQDVVLPPPPPDAIPPHLRLHRMAGLGHVPHTEAMKTVNGLIAAFDAEA